MNPWLSFIIGIVVGIIIVVVFLRVIERGYIIVSNPSKGYFVKVSKTDNKESTHE